MRPRNKLVIVCLALTLLTFLTPICAPAEYIDINSRAIFLNNDYADWLNFGAPFTTVPSGSSIASSVFNLPLTVANANGASMQALQQGNGWNGNFAPGNGLLWTDLSVSGTSGNGPLIINFPTAIFGVGAQIQSDIFGAFTGTITAYDGMGNVLTTFSLAGNSTAAGDNSAIFLGILDSNSQIRSIAFDVGDHDFAINQLDFLVCPGSVPVPIPGTVLLLGSGLLALLGLRRKSRP